MNQTADAANPEVHATTAPSPSADQVSSLLSILFLISGFAALVYQVVWQRALFTAFGVNIETITIIVAVFMFGLGTGALIGGALSKRFPDHLLQLFVLSEMGIGLFGLVSLTLIHGMADFAIHGSLWTVGLASYALLVLPTLMMGATLPILVAYLHRLDPNIGRIVGTLYCVNTLGSAVAAFATVTVLFRFLGLQATATLAALCNFGVAASAYWLLAQRRALAATTPPVEEAGEDAAGETSSRRRLFVVLAAAAATGYLSLSQEIIWMRALHYVEGDKATTFGMTLGFILIGIALGARFARRCGDRPPGHALAFAAVMLALSVPAYYLALPAAAWLFTQTLPITLLFCYFMVGLVAFLLGAVFPALCHYAIRSREVGSWLSWIYFANIVGATAGPLITGFILLDHFTLEQNNLFLSLFAGGLSILLAWEAGAALPGRAALAGGMVLGLAGIMLLHPWFYHDLLVKLHIKDLYPTLGSYRHLVQRRSGIVAVVVEDKHNLIFGGAVYDGRFNIDPLDNTNRIRRPYLMAALHVDPQEVLMIGLSSGSWTRVLADHERVRKVTSIEINPAYLEIIPHYPEIASILTDPKVEILIDDGRRWLLRHPDARFDFIAMNTSHHWRAHSTHTLSTEFLELCRQHLKPGGVMMFNTTSSEDVVYTAAQVFRYVARYDNAIACSDSPFTQTVEERRENLKRFRHHGRPVFDGPEAQAVLEELATADLADQAEALRRRPGLWRITDDNMATEFKVASQPQQ